MTLPALIVITQTGRPIPVAFGSAGEVTPSEAQILGAEISSLTATISLVSGSLGATLGAQVSTLEVEIGSLTDGNITLAGELGTISGEVGSLVSEAASLSTALTTETARAEAAEISLSGTVGTLEAEIGSLTAGNITLAGELGTISGEVGSMVTELPAESARAEAAEGSLTAEIGSLISEVASFSSSLQVTNGTLTMTPSSIKFGAGTTLTASAVQPNIVQSFDISLGNPPDETAFDDAPTEGNLLVVFCSGIGAAGVPNGYAARYSAASGVALSYLGTKTSAGESDEDLTISVSTGSGRQIQTTGFEVANYGSLGGSDGIVSGTTLSASPLASTAGSLVLTQFHTTNGVALSNPQPAGSTFLFNGGDPDGWAYCVVASTGTGGNVTVSVEANGEASAAYTQIEIRPNPSSSQADVTVGSPYTKPLAANFTAASVGSDFSFSDTSEGLCCKGGPSGEANWLADNLPVSGSWSFTAGFEYSAPDANEQIGIFLQDTDGKLIFFGVNPSGGTAPYVQALTYTSYSGSVGVIYNASLAQTFKWFQIRYDGTNFYFSAGTKRNNVILLATQSASAFLGNLAAGGVMVNTQALTSVIFEDYTRA